MVLIHYREYKMSYDLNKIEAAVFRRIINHFKDNTEIQNIDVMKTAGFCRNCARSLVQSFCKATY